jgi:2-amino-4-hydroxy-6-hydroxymethyldihydropteridine diphosphokinase
VTAVLSLGSNLGNRLANLRAGVEVLGMHAAVSRVSAVYETEPVGVTKQRSYFNCVVLLATSDPWIAFGAARAAETTRGRLRSSRWGPRTLDVDVIDVEGVTRDDEVLTLPHPRAAERAFVLRPWLDLDADAEVAGRGPVWRLLRSLPDQQAVRRVAVL